jgi:hypothetical protein
MNCNPTPIVASPRAPAGPGGAARGRQGLVAAGTVLTLAVLSLAGTGCAVRNGECQCPTDARAIYLAVGEQAVRKCPCHPDEMYHGYQPTCWHAWPAGWDAYKTQRCEPLNCAAAQPTESTESIDGTTLIPTEALPPVPQTRPAEPPIELAPQAPKRDDSSEGEVPSDGIPARELPETRPIPLPRGLSAPPASARTAPPSTPQPTLPRMGPPGPPAALPRQLEQQVEAPLKPAPVPPPRARYAAPTTPPAGIGADPLFDESPETLRDDAPEQRRTIKAYESLPGPTLPVDTLPTPSTDLSGGRPPARSLPAGPRPTQPIIERPPPVARPLDILDGGPRPPAGGGPEPTPAPPPRLGIGGPSLGPSAAMFGPPPTPQAVPWDASDEEVARHNRWLEHVR